ncbi:Spectinomycin tetracycline efflux pump [Hartmannibacter diazotrophicus]|uniref:Spectinomycin tetracycline efflux pump n=1 Tax=Hartmannibacter diazotrophicus TaxID=1482074 RepID=A0A2C9D3C7_9HYPH|nr:MFS transporter [Hartmannibacter diazotrophicus]SON54689.1 Spectinomycin tetracycline efflux pump [Hartmannibacter diazotrophicus]
MANPSISDDTLKERSTPAPSSGWALVSLALSMLLSSLGVSIANVALPAMAEAFAAPFQDVQWIILSYLLAVTVAIVGAGRLGDVLGHRRVLLAGVLLFTAASLLCGLAPTLATLIAARGAQGLGAAVLMALTVAFVRETVPRERTGRAMGLLGTMSAIGTALGPSLGGALIAGFDWRAIFLVLVPLGLTAFLVGSLALPKGQPSTAANRPGFDLPGTLVLALTLAAYTLAVTANGEHFDLPHVALVVLAAAGTGLFVRIESRAGSPLIRLAAFRYDGLGAGLGMNALVATVMMTTLVVGPFYLSRALGLSNAFVGVVMSIGPVISALTGLPSGRLVDRLGAQSVVFAGLAAMAVGAFLLATLPAVFGISGYVAAIAILTPGYQLFQAANNTAVMMDIGPDQRGAISGLLSLSRNLGLMTGASVMGAVFAFGVGSGDMASAPANAIAAGMQTTFMVAAALVVVGMAIGLASRALCARVAPTEGSREG